MDHGNWKCQAENSTDGWHAHYIGESALQLLERFGSRGLQPDEQRPVGEVVGERTDEIPPRALYREWVQLMASSSTEEVEDGR